MAINYSKVGWNTNSYVNPVNMNQMDDGIKSACDAIDDLGDDLDKFIRAEDELGTETTETRDADILGGQYTASNITTMQNSINTLNNNLAQKADGKFAILNVTTNSDETWKYTDLPSGFIQSNTFIVSVKNTANTSQFFNLAEQFEYFLEGTYFVCRGLTPYNQGASLKVLLYHA